MLCTEYSEENSGRSSQKLPWGHSMDTQVEAINRIRTAKAIQRSARLNRRVNSTIEFSISAACLLLLGGFVVTLLNWHTHNDLFAVLVHQGADLLAWPLKPFLSYSTLSFKGGVFAPIYLIAAATYIIVGITISWMARRLLQGERA